MSILLSHQGVIASGSVDAIALSIWNKMTDWWDLNEASGDFANGKSARTMTRTSTVGTRQGPAGSGDVAADFDSTGGYGETADNAALRLGDRDFCMWGWIITDTTSATRFPWSKWNAQTNTREYGLYVYSGGVGIQYRDLANANKAFDFSATVPSSWTFVYIYQNRTTGNLGLRINGAGSGTETTDAVFASTSGFLVSGLRDAAGDVVNKNDGGVSRLGMAADALLTDDEQAWLYNTGKGRTISQVKSAAGV